jgi:hypothetical protein
MKVFVFLYLCFVLLACSTTGTRATQSTTSSNSTFANDKQQILESLGKLRLERCHTQLTDLQDLALLKSFRYYQKNDDSFEENLLQQQKSAIESVHQIRMTLRSHINQWVLEDPKISLECAQLAFRTQQVWEQLEEEIAYFLYHKNKDWPLDQKVFMNSKEQLLSNPFVSSKQKMTSLSDLQNGDIIVQTQTSSTQEMQTHFVIYRNEQDAIYSLEPLADGHWQMVPLYQSNSWLKRKAERLIVLRNQNRSKAQETVSLIVESINRRKPSSFKKFPFHNWESLLADPQYVNVMEWKNYLGLHKGRLQGIQLSSQSSVEQKNP